MYWSNHWNWMRRSLSQSFLLVTPSNLGCHWQLCILAKKPALTSDLICLRLSDMNCLENINELYAFSVTNSKLFFLFTSVIWLCTPFLCNLFLRLEGQNNYYFVTVSHPCIEKFSKNISTILCAHSYTLQCCWDNVPDLSKPPDLYACQNHISFQPSMFPMNSSLFGPVIRLCHGSIVYVCCLRTTSFIVLFLCALEAVALFCVLSHFSGDDTCHGNDVSIRPAARWSCRRWSRSLLWRLEQVGRYLWHWIFKWRCMLYKESYVFDFVGTIY